MIDHFQSHAAVGGGVHVVSRVTNHILEQLPDLGFVLNDQNPLAQQGGHSNNRRFRTRLRRPALYWQLDDKRCSTARRAFEVDTAAVLANNRLRNA